MSLHRIRVMVADDHPAISLGISYELSQCGSLEMLGQVSNSTELIGRLDEGDCDVVIVDYTMPGGKYGDGLALLSLLRRRYPHLQLVVFTMLNNPGLIRAILKQGINCILSKSDSTSHLLAAVSAAYSRNQYFSPSIRDIFVNQVLSSHNERLTPREAEIVRLFGSGLTITKIAERSHRSVQTISTQKVSAMKKLGIKRDADLIRYAAEGYCRMP
ncbi:response regulator transcription factor [Pseudomonas aeruginosa]|nr:response regulator transcription factor [Pseudomonas aeruginosa]